MIANSVKVSSTGSSLVTGAQKNMVTAALFYLVCGVAFIGWGVFDDMSFLLALGAIFVVFGVATWVRARRIAAPKP